ncbi:hypothetical protein BDQ17DRAFT_979542 [Cyathus striatus]|nr:hypothetical protein BDQ17DRAFT_979542 [Cyathus striatus]
MTADLSISLILPFVYPSVVLTYSVNIKSVTVLLWAVKTHPRTAHAFQKLRKLQPMRLASRQASSSLLDAHHSYTDLRRSNVYDITATVTAPAVMNFH